MIQDSPELSVVVPVHNERDNVTILSQRLGAVLEEYGRQYEIIFVDDGSSDGTIDCNFTPKTYPKSWINWPKAMTS